MLKYVCDGCEKAIEPAESTLTVQALIGTVTANGHVCAPACYARALAAVCARLVETLAKTPKSAPR